MAYATEFLEPVLYCGSQAFEGRRMLVHRPLHVWREPAAGGREVDPACELDRAPREICDLGMRIRHRKMISAGPAIAIAQSGYATISELDEWFDVEKLWLAPLTR
ncbi:MAG: hypothetical protein ABR509_06440 [Candidatus Limnocylindria bacterium]